MALYKSMLVARSDLKMALKVTYVKFGLLGVAAIGPIMMIGIVFFMVLADPVFAVLFLPSLSAMMSPMLGMMAIMPAALISANALVGEREQNTLEPLLSTPLTDRELLIGKLLSSFIPSLALLLGSIAVTEIATIVILMAFGQVPILIPGIPGLFLLLTAGPLMIIAIVSVMILISGKVKRVYEAYQTSAAAIIIFFIPMMLPMLTMDASGIVDLNSVWMSNIVTVLIAAVLAAITWSIAVRRFNRDTMISM